jgi:hypothetical protein
MRRFGRTLAADAPETPGRQPQLLLMDGPLVADRFEIPAGVSYVGRQHDLELVLASGLVSSVHAKIRNREGRVTVEDLESTNGTWVGQERVEDETALTPGDAVRFGDVSLTYALGTAGPGAADGRRRRWWVELSQAAKTAVLTAGALAAAVSAVVALWPDDDPGDSARVTAVQVLETRMPLSRYETRPPVITSVSADAADGRSGVRLVAGVVPALAEESSDPASSAEPTGGESPTPDGTATESSPVEPTSRSTSATGLPELSSILETYEAVREVAPLVRSAADDVNFAVPPTPAITQTRSVSIEPVTAMTAAAVRDVEGNLVDKQVAASRVVSLLKQVRTTPVTTPEGVLKDPVGALVDVDLELSGLRDQTVSLTWQVRRVGSAEPLYGEWMRRVEAYRLTPSTDHDTATVTDMWIPVPKQPGPFVVVVRVHRDDFALGSGRSDPFS